MIDKIDTRAEIEAERSTTNNIKSQWKNELHVNKNSINTYKFIRPTGGSGLSSQYSHSSKDPDRLENLQLRPPVETRGRSLKEISRNMYNPNYNSCDQCDYIADGKNNLLIHMQNHYKGLEREYLYKMESEIQIVDKVQCLKQQNS